MHQKTDTNAKWTHRLLAIFFISLLAIFTIQTAKAETLVLAAADSRPTAYMENGKPAGLLVDIVTEAFRRAGYPIRIELKPWARCLSEARDGIVDGVFSSFKSPEREAFLNFTAVPVMTQVEALFVRTNSTIQFDGDLSKLAPVKIGVIQSTSYGEKIDGMINTGTWNKVSKTISIDSLVRMLAAERFDLAPSYRDVFLSAAKKAGVADQVRELSPSVESVPSYLAFNKKKDYSRIIIAFNKAMEEMKKDKTLDAMNDQYMK